MSVKYLAAPLLCHYANGSVTKEGIIKVFNSIGACYDEKIVEHVVKYIACHGMDEALATGMSSMSSLPTGGAVSSAAAPAAAGGAVAEEAKPAEPEEEEEDDDMGFGLFD